jgi:hypothetical protein
VVSEKDHNWSKHLNRLFCRSLLICAQEESVLVRKADILTTLGYLRSWYTQAHQVVNLVDKLKHRHDVLESFEHSNRGGRALKPYLTELIDDTDISQS